MEIVSIFEDQLSAFRYQKEQPDEFSRLFKDWQDPEYLFRFFSEHSEDLQSGFYGNISLQTAIMQTRDDAKTMEKNLLQLIGNESKSLDLIFEPLRLEEPIEYARSKAKGEKSKSWLRVYAIKVEANVYVVTGGAIKLTRSMQQRKHTYEELLKIDRCKNFLRELGILDLGGLKELIL